MSDKKLTLGLPIALALGGSAIAFGLVPGVRDWVDNAVPWLGINGPKIAAIAPSSEGLNSETANRPLPSESAPDQLSKTKFDVQFAGGLAPIASEPVGPEAPASQANALPPTAVPATEVPPGGFQPSLSAQDETAAASQFIRATQATPLQSVPAGGLNVPTNDQGLLFVPLATVSFPDDITISATAEGTILNLFVDDGSVIEAGKPMIEIDSRLAEEEVKVAEKELMAANLKANDDSNVKYSEAAKDVAIQDVEISNQLLKKNAEGIMENRKKQLELKKASLQVTVSKIEKERDTADVGVKTAKLDAAAVQVSLRKINAQRTGIVNEVVKRQFSYVRAGEPILNLTSMEKIRIKGMTPRLMDSPHLLLNAPAKVTIFYAEQKSETVNGTVTFVSPKSSNANQYQLHVDLPNKLTPDGQYLFRDGMQATIEVTPRSR